MIQTRVLITALDRALRRRAESDFVRGLQALQRAVYRARRAA